MNLNKFITISPNERVLNLTCEEDRKLLLEWIAKNKDKLPNFQIIKNKNDFES